MKTLKEQYDTYTFLGHQQILVLQIQQKRGVTSHLTKL